MAEAKTPPPLPQKVLEIKVKANGLWQKAAQNHALLLKTPDKTQRFELAQEIVENVKEYKDLNYILKEWERTGEVLKPLKEEEAEYKASVLKQKADELPEDLQGLKLKKRNLISMRSQAKAQNNAQRVEELQDIINLVNEKIATLNPKRIKTAPKRRGRPRKEA